MFKHILVPIDLSDRNARAPWVALELARQSRARVTLLHVIQSVPSIPPGELKAFYRELTRAALAKLARVARRFVAGRVEVRTELAIGEPAREIVRLAARRRADLVVMGSHRIRPGRPATGWSTTSYKASIFCRCPILLVK